jgi:hypothetical protein
MNNKGKVIVEMLIMLVVIVITSALILYLVQSGTITVKAENDQVSILNTEFIPMGREGYLAIKDFKFCDFVDLNYNCVGETENFFLGSEVYFLFVVETTTVSGQIMVVENYRIKGPNGELLLDVDEKNNFNFDITSKERKESITFKDFFVVGSDLSEGEYTLELIVNNPLLNKKTTSVKKFQMESGEDFEELDFNENYFDEEYLDEEYSDEEYLDEEYSDEEYFVEDIEVESEFEEEFI